MGIKDLFSNKVTSFSSYESASADVESIDFVEKSNLEKEVFIPLIDYSKPFEYIKFGSAELYFKNSIERVHDTYPYDGSAKDKKDFVLSSSFVDRYIYDLKYPKTTGFITLTNQGYGTSAISSDGYGANVSADDHEYIFVGGGLHVASEGMKAGELYKNFDKSTIYDQAKNRTQNFRINPTDGTTVEFWLNKDNFVSSFTEKEVVLDVWNGNASSSADYGRLTVYLTASTDGADPIRVAYQSGTVGIFDQSIVSSNFNTASIADGNWHHYAISFLSQSTSIKTFFYVDGVLENEQTHGSVGIDEFSGRLNTVLGALQTSPSGSSASAYSGKLSASLDEFRFWKTRRTSKQINYNWYRPIDGGSNTEDNNTSLGCYFKFNEGIVGDNSLDNVVLDYSGRLANGSWTGYVSGARSTDSCFELANVIDQERPDPIIRQSHPSVVALKSEMQTSGSEYDITNATMLYKRVPSYFREQDEASNKSTKFLYQIISSYFDVLYAQIKVLPTLTNNTYVGKNSKPIPFASRLLQNRGFNTEQIFENSNLLEYIADNDRNNNQYDLDLETIKNLIYQNIYNNLDFIYKTKGTESSIRNLLRCFGVDDELVKLNVYTDGGKHYFNDNFKDSSITQRFISFNNTDRFGSTITQTTSSNNSLNYITGTVADKKERFNSFTFEVGVNIPTKFKEADVNYFTTNFLSSSVFGFHEASSNDYTWPATELANAQIYLVRDELESNRAKFLLTNRDGSLLLSSSYIDEIYNDNQWVLAIRVEPEGYGVIGSVLTSSNPNYEISFYGVSHEFGQVRNEFNVSSSLNYHSGSSYLSNPKRIYTGAHRTNFTGSVLQQSDIEISSCKFWFDYVDNEELRSHSKDIKNKGVSRPTSNSSMFFVDLENTDIPRTDLLCLDWEFDLLSSADSSGEFIVEDLSSGSSDVIYGWIDDIIRKENKGLGFGFPNSSNSFLKTELVYTSKKEMPEISYTSDSIRIMDDKKKFFIEDEDKSDNFFSLEKSAYNIVSEQMLEMLSSVVEFNTLIGQPVDRYRNSYKSLDSLRQMFFEKVNSNIDFDRFTEYYRFIDDSISSMVSQLFPVSARHSTKISNMIESHIFERNKYQNKFPLTTRLASTEGSARGVGELTYNWKFGHAPVGLEENKNCLWNKERKERTDITDRETIRQSINNRNNIAAPTLFKTDGTSYQGSTFAINRLSKPYKEGIDFNHSIHGGINYNKGKNRDFVYDATHIHGPISTTYPKGIPQNVMVVGVGEGQGTDAFIDCVDEQNPNEKRKWRFSAVIGRDATGFDPQARVGKDYQHKVKSSLYWPSNVVSGTVTSGYNKEVVEKFKSGSIITNLHSDTFSPTNDIGMQGPFTEAWVGGHQSRHVNLNKFDATKTTPNNLDDEYSRPEAWRLLLKECANESPHGDGSIQGSNDGAMGFVGPDYGGPYPDYTRKYAIRYRDERTKRPLNVRNIRTTTGSAVHGNFVENYEVVHTFGRKQNSKGFNKSGGVVLNPFFDGLPTTTQEASLVGVERTIKATAIITIADRPNDGDTITFADGLLGPTILTFKTVPSNDDHIQRGASASQSRQFAEIKLESRFNVSVERVGDNLNITNDNLLGSRANVTLTSSFASTNNSVSGFTGAIGGNGNTYSSFDGTNIIAQSVKDQQVADANTFGNTVIATRFSAPGGFETMSEVFLDVVSKEYSVYNALPFRNLSVRGSGSGEAGTIRVNSHANRREGLRTLIARHSGRFGIDSLHGSVVTDNYNTEASFQKINRNTRVIVETGSLIITDSFDNFNVSRPIPSQDYGYSWVTASLGEELSVRSGNQLVFGYWPPNGVLSASSNVSWRRNGFDSAINFPTSSNNFRGIVI